MHLKMKFANFIYFGNSKFYILNLGQYGFGLLYFQAHRQSHHIKYEIFSTPLKIGIEYIFASWKNLGIN